MTRLVVLFLLALVMSGCSFVSTSSPTPLGKVMFGLIACHETPEMTVKCEPPKGP